MLDQQGEEITREGVLQLLRSLDPPEAYCSEDARLDILDRPVREARRESLTQRHTPSGQPQSVSLSNQSRSKQSGFAITSFVLAMLSIPSIIVPPIGSVFALVAFVFGVIALPQIAASHGRLRGSWMAYVACAVMALQTFAAWGLLMMM